MTEIKELYPSILWERFQEICEIPHPSHHEEKIINYVVELGKKLGLNTVVDKAGNVIIKKPATAGMENRKTVALQAHLDMVPQANKGTNHDFENDPIQAFIDKDWVTAKDTTLGSDNGIGVATMLALLCSSDIPHGPIEALFTVQEETGMHGAFGLDKSILEAEIMLNLDSEDEDELIIGCAGGVDFSAFNTYRLEDVPDGYIGLNISISGLKGGHSGIDIILERANANVLMARLLSSLISEFDAKIAEIKGGNMRNAIPREAFATLLIPEANANSLSSFLQSFNNYISKEYSSTDAFIHIQFNECEAPLQYMEDSKARGLIKALLSCPNGVIRMEKHIENVVETSTNLSIITVGNGNIEIHCLLRSSSEEAKMELAHTLEHIFMIFGFKLQISGAYPGWKPNKDSEILKLFQEVYPKQMGREPNIKVIHAGLECGVIGSIYPNTDIVSFGPTIRFPHSPDEKVNISSVGRYWDLFVEILRNIPTKRS